MVNVSRAQIGGRTVAKLSLLTLARALSAEDESVMLSRARSAESVNELEVCSCCRPDLALDLQTPHHPFLRPAASPHMWAALLIAKRHS